MQFTCECYQSLIVSRKLVQKGYDCGLQTTKIKIDLPNGEFSGF